LYFQAVSREDFKDVNDLKAFTPKNGKKTPSCCPDSGDRFVELQIQSVPGGIANAA
jgi:hypothetical protein